jgi:hypothetical protein
MNDQRTLRPIALAKNGAYNLLERAESDLAAGRIDEEDWYHAVASIITPSYLAADNPRSQSGHSGDDAHWTQARSLIADAIDRDGTFLDVGCASGYLMECMPRWARQAGGHRIEPFGLDIAPQLAELARRRLPHWADRIHVGNALYWRPKQRFDFVRTGLEYVPRRRQRDLIVHLLKHVVAEQGRLIIGTYNEEREPAAGAATTAALVQSCGFALRGSARRPHFHDPRLEYRVLWIDAPT